MRWAIVIGLVAACGGGGSRPDASPPPPDPSQCNPPSLPLCSTVCGNNRIDDCERPNTSHDGVLCPGYLREREECDGTQKPACTTRGYYGGAGTCTTRCTFTVTGCVACASGPQIVDCESYDELSETLALVANGDRVLLATRTGGPLRVRVLRADAAAFTELALHAINVDAVTSVPDGWLVASYGPTATIRHVALDGTLGSERPVWPGDPFAGVITYGAGNRALVAWTVWNGLAQTSATWIAVLDAAGNVVVEPRELLPTLGMMTVERLSVTSDGTAFFLASTRDALLRRIDSAGAVIAETTGLFTTASRSIVWSGTTGWYFSLTSMLTAQRFDGTGAPVGAPIQVPSISTVAPQADGLLAVRATQVAPLTVRFELVRVDASGTVGDPVEVGVGSGGVVAGIAGRAALTWSGAGRQHLALVSPL